MKVFIGLPNCRQAASCAAFACLSILICYTGTHTSMQTHTCWLTQKETESGGACRGEGEVGIPKDLLLGLGQHNQCRNRKQRELCAVQRPCSFNVGVFEPEIKINNSKSVKQTNNKQAAAPAPARLWLWLGLKAIRSKCDPHSAQAASPDMGTFCDKASPLPLRCVCVCVYN